MKLSGYFGSLTKNQTTHKEEFVPFNSATISLKSDSKEIHINTNTIGGYTVDVPEGSYTVSFSFKGNNSRLLPIKRGQVFVVDKTTKLNSLDEWIKSNEITPEGEDYDHTTLESRIDALENGKADKSAITPLATKESVDLKADKTALDSLATKTSVEAKADKTDIVPLATKTEVEAKADKTALTSLATKTDLDTKADKTDLTPLALKTDVENKVDKALYDALVKRVEALEAPAE